ncbi:MAG TPA: imidazolonepropionase [Chthonomonadales bacterium]|nr:imidazolonepropionase [Chthonomonadales bacterium]
MPIDLVIRNARQLLSMAGPKRARSGSEQAQVGLIEDGAVAVSEASIVAVGHTEAILRLPGVSRHTEEIDARGRVVTPGLVDSHTHLVFGGNRVDEFEMRTGGATYQQIMASGGGIYSTVRATRRAGLQELKDSAAVHLREMLANGTTTAEAKSGYGLDLETERKQLEAVRELDSVQAVELVPTFLGAHAVPEGSGAKEYVELLCAHIIPEIGARKAARFCDVFCEPGVFSVEESEQILRAGLANGLQPKVHADELSNSAGACLAARVGATSADHLHCVDEYGLQAMARADTIGTLLPGTALFLGLSHHAPARRMVQAGVPIALATDFNPGSCFCRSMPLMISLGCTQLGLTPAEALVASTINGAYAVDLGDRTGSLEPGKQADLVIWQVDDYRAIAYEMGARLVETAVKRGKRV